MQEAFNEDTFHKVRHLVPLFIAHVPAAKNLHSSVDAHHKKHGIGKKLILAIRAVLCPKRWTWWLVAFDFDGAAWRRDNSNNFSIIEEACRLRFASASWLHTIVGTWGSSR